VEWQQLITDCYERMSQVLEKTLDGLTQEDLNQQPHPDCNSMGWITWHMSRVLDRWLISDLIGEEQLWVSDGWHSRFKRPSAWPHFRPQLCLQYPMPGQRHYALEHRVH